MSHELLSINLAVLGLAGSEQELWRMAAGMATIPVNCAVYPADAGVAALTKGGIDICLMDDRLPEAVKTAALAATKSLNPAPSIFLRAARGTPRPIGVTGLLPAPTTAAEAHTLIEACIRTRMPTRVLIVDDSSTMRAIVRKILASTRFKLDLHDAAEGFAALDRLRQEEFGLVFLDYNMPGFNGFETLSEIKRERPKVAVVMMTTTVDEQLAERAAALGAHGFLRKPFYPADIDRVLDRYYGLAFR